MSDDLPNMHDKANNALVRLLSERLSGVCSGIGDIGQAIVKPAGNTPVPTDAAKVAGQGGDIERDKGPIA